MIPYSTQSLDLEDALAVLEVLASDWLTQGPQVGEFEAALADVTGAKYAVAFSNGTSALHAAVLAAGLGPSDYVITSSLSFVASGNCARYVGAQVGFVDIDPDTLNMDIAGIPPCDAVVAVHYAGLPVDLRLMSDRPRIVIEDASHALGATTPDGPIGNCAYSDMCTFSFHPVKAVTTGEGGAVTTNNPNYANALRLIRNHGIERHPELGDWYYEVRHTGYNFRMTDMQAALGRSQLAKAAQFILRRRAIASRYDLLLRELPVQIPPRAPDGFSHAYHLYPLRVPRRESVYTRLKRLNISTQVHYVPMHWHPIFNSAGFPKGSLPAVEEAYDHLISIPIYPSMTEEQQTRVVDALLQVLTA